MSNLCHVPGEFAQVVDPVVRGELGEVFAPAVAVGDGAGFDSGAAAGLHVGGGIAHEETVLGPGAHGGQGGEEDIRGRFGGEAVGALHVVEVLDQPELRKDGAGGGTAFGGCGALAAAERGKAFGDAGVDGGLAVAAGEIDCAVLQEQVVHPLLCGIGDHLGEEIEEVPANVAFECIEGDGAGWVDGEHLLDGAADVSGAVQQSAVDIEQVNRERGDHAGCEPSLRPASGRITCCTPPPGVSRGACGARVWPLINWVTSLPSRISRTSSISAMVTRASECWSMTASAVS